MRGHAFVFAPLASLTRSLLPPGPLLPVSLTSAHPTVEGAV
jgi:hypothetical protein